MACMHAPSFILLVNYSTAGNIPVFFFLFFPQGTGTTACACSVLTLTDRPGGIGSCGLGGKLRRFHLIPRGSKNMGVYCCARGVVACRSIHLYIFRSITHGSIGSRASSRPRVGAININDSHGHLASFSHDLVRNL
jgi:hypothetical protein